MCVCVRVYVFVCVLSAVVYTVCQPQMDKCWFRRHIYTLCARLIHCISLFDNMKHIQHNMYYIHFVCMYIVCVCFVVCVYMCGICVCGGGLYVYVHGMCARVIHGLRSTAVPDVCAAYASHTSCAPSCGRTRYAGA